MATDWSPYRAELITRSGWHERTLASALARRLSDRDQGTGRCGPRTAEGIVAPHGLHRKRGPGRGATVKQLHRLRRGHHRDNASITNADALVGYIMDARNRT
jgi:hypothetical protein